MCDFTETTKTQEVTTVRLLGSFAQEKCQEDSFVSQSDPIVCSKVINQLYYKVFKVYYEVYINELGYKVIFLYILTKPSQNL